MRCRSGLPEWFDENIDTDCLDALNDGSYAAFGTADGRVYGSDDGGLRWLELITGRGDPHEHPPQSLGLLHPRIGRAPGRCVDRLCVRQR